MQHPQSRGVWRNGDFLKLWAGQTVSLFGSRITDLALPLTAITVFNATPAEMGILGAMQLAPFMLVALFAGLWVDRLPRRPILIAADVGRGLVIALVPALALMGKLRIELLYPIALLSGVLQAFFELAYQAYVPSLVKRDVLVDANSKLQTSTSAAEIGGPAIAGLLIERITAPMAILIDALSFFISTFSFLVIRTPETPPQQNMMKRGLIAQIGEGFGIVLRDAYLRAMLIEAAMYNFFASAFGALFVLYATRDLGLSPAMLGLVFGAGSVGSLLGAVVSARLMHAIGLGRALISAVALACVPNLLIPLAGGETHVAATILSVAYVLLGLGLGVSQVYVWSLRQTLVPSNLLGRMNAAYRFFITGASPFGALLGGVLGGQIGLRPTLLLCAIGFIVALLTIAISPLRTLQRLPDELEHTK